MTDQNLAVIVLAAGQGTRMKSSLPKILHPLAGVPIVGHVLATARELDPAHVVVVVRHERDVVAATIVELLPEAVIVDQDEIPGTGRAVEQAIAALPRSFVGDVVIVSGDVPLLDAATLTGLLAAHRAGVAAATLLSAFFDDATGYGRIVRTEDGSVDRIVEQKDATPEELDIHEVNSGSYVFHLEPLREQLAHVTVHNAQGEKYVTDVIGLLRAAGSEVTAVPVSENWIVGGINDRVQLGETAPEPADHPRVAARRRHDSRPRKHLDRPAGHHRGRRRAAARHHDLRADDHRARSHHRPRHQPRHL
jgi:bifunctional UDP-N-acetylglucosamine pyrophosphorylase/glucosamine-1-phosphate N-acetyltransferase